MKIHTIRLGRAWQIVSLDGGECVVQRRFNAPTGISGDQEIQLHLRCEPGIECQAAVLNQTQLGSSFAVDSRINLTGQLQLGNVLQLTLSGSQIAEYFGAANARQFDITPLCQVELEILGE